MKKISMKFHKISTETPQIFYQNSKNILQELRKFSSEISQNFPQEFYKFPNEIPQISTNSTGIEQIFNKN